MYFAAKIEIDPSQLTRIKSLVPNSIMGKVLATLTLGTTSKKLEQETFTVMSILNQFHDVFSSININNAVRVSVDNHNFFEDKSGIDDDLDQAMFEIKYKIDPIESEHFDFVNLVLEHRDENLKYLIDIQIHKKHKIGEFPIQIVVTALLLDFKKDYKESVESMNNKLSKVFENQNVYDNYIRDKERQFSIFVSTLEFAIIQEIQVDFVRKNIYKFLVRPKQAVESFKTFETYNKMIKFEDSSLIHPFTAYTLLWLELCYKNNIFLENYILIDEESNPICTIGKEGIMAGGFQMLDMYSEFEPVESKYITYQTGSLYQDKLIQKKLINPDNKRESKNTEEWLSGYYEFIY